MTACNVPQPLKRSGPTVLRPQSTTGSTLWGGDPLRQMGPPSGPPKYSKTAHFGDLLMHLWGGWIISTECSPIYTDLWTIFKRKRPLDLPSHEKWEQKPPKYYYSFMPRFHPSSKTFIFVKSVKIAAIITERAGDRLTQVSAGHVWVAHYWIWLISFVDRRISTHGFSTEMAIIRPKRCLDDKTQIPRVNLSSWGKKN